MADLQTIINVIVGQCQMLEIEDDPFLRRVHVRALLDYATKAYKLVNGKSQLTLSPPADPENGAPE